MIRKKKKNYRTLNYERTARETRWSVLSSSMCGGILKKKINEFRLLTGQFAEHHDGGRARDINGFGPFGGGRRRLGPKRGVGHHRVIVIVDRGGR